MARFRIQAALVCFLLTLVSLIPLNKARPGENCMQSPPLTGTTYCVDYKTALTCLQKEAKNPDLGDTELLMIEDNIRYCQAKIEADNECPHLWANGTCFDEEVSRCVRLYPGRGDVCKSAEDIVTCLKALNSTCSQPQLLDIIRGKEKHAEKCRKGVYSCHYAIHKCVQSWRDLHRASNSAQACQEAKKAGECLDSLTCNYEADYMKEYKDWFERNSAKDCHPASCTPASMDRCEEKMYDETSNGFKDLSDDFRQLVHSTSCSVYAKCVEDIKLQCSEDAVNELDDRKRKFMTMSKCSGE